jgi:flavin-dependent dehydrogenase
VQTETYDAIVIGARVAGASTAMLLARKGHHVLLVDKAEFPSDTVSTHNLTLAAMASLKRWGLYDTIASGDCPAVDRVVFDMDGLVLEGWSGPFEGINAMYNVRRTVLDQLLIEAACEGGVDFRPGFRVQDLIVEDGLCSGIRGHDRAGDGLEARAPIVVGADGRHSKVAARMGSREYRHMPASTFTYYSYFSGLPMNGRMEFYDREGQTIVAQPTSRGLTMVATIRPAAGFKHFRADIEGNFLRGLEAAPAFAERVRRATREEPFAGSVDVPNTMRVPYGPGFALVGDAGLHVDPTMGQGITNAFRDAELLADAIDAGLRGEKDLSVALAAYHEARDAAVTPMFELICEMISGEPPSEEFITVLGCLPGNQTRIDQFIGVMLGTVPVADFYSPENLAAIVAEAQTPGRAAA